MSLRERVMVVCPVYDTISNKTKEFLSNLVLYRGDNPLSVHELVSRMQENRMHVNINIYVTGLADTPHLDICYTL